MEAVVNIYGETLTSTYYIMLAARVCCALPITSRLGQQEQDEGLTKQLRLLTSGLKGI